MYEFFRRKLLERKFLMADETPLQVLHEPERRAQTKSYMWLYRTGEDGEPPIVIYQYSETRAGENAAEFLEDFDGYLMCDGYGGYNLLKKATRTACYAHIRRYLTEAIPKGKELDYAHFLNSNELSQGKIMLTSAALTYVASVFNTLLQILRLILMFGRRDD